MFDIAWSEMILIGAVALVVIGPKDLPKALRSVGEAVGKVKRMAAEFQGQFNDAMREAELHEIKKQVEDVGGSVQAATKVDFNPIQTIREELKTAADTRTGAAAAGAAVNSAGVDGAAAMPLQPIEPYIPMPEPPPPVDLSAFQPVTPAADPAPVEPTPDEKPKRSRKAKPVADGAEA
jgi:sec-independent protein translocase protein TatB